RARGGHWLPRYLLPQQRREPLRLEGTDDPLTADHEHRHSADAHAERNHIVQPEDGVGTIGGVAGAERFGIAPCTAQIIDEDLLRVAASLPFPLTVQQQVVHLPEHPLLARTFRRSRGVASAK